MRILFLSSVYPRPYDPVRGVYCRSLCEALAARHAVRVVSPVAWTERLRSGRAQAASPGFGTVPVEYPTYYYPPGGLRSAHGWFMWRSVRGTVRRALREFAPDCVLSYWLHPDGDVAVRAARSIGVPSAVIVGGSDARLLPKDPRRRPSVVHVLERADALMTVSRGLKDDLIQLGTPAEKVHVSYQGIDQKLFHPGNKAAARARLGLPADQKAVVFVGGLVPVKGLDILLAATARLVRGGTDFHLYLVGGGPLRTALSAQAKSLGLAGRVALVGPQPQDRLPDWYRAADLSVLASRSEGIPNVLRESLACGTPFVATRVGDVAEFCPDAQDDLVPPGDPAALAGALGRALAGHGQRRLLPRPATWDENALEMAGLLEDLVLRHRAPGSARVRATGREAATAAY
jgi:glycosyltransferase involved in cell wall biosynthesis